MDNKLKPNNRLSDRYYINIQPTAPPPGGYPKKIKIPPHTDYIRYGQQPSPEGAGEQDAYWHQQIITQTWYQAETGKIPISGAGYGGEFAGTGFDGIWFDMSEIVRPTRDGIHGREFISTEINLGQQRKLAEDKTDEEAGFLYTPGLTLPIPFIFNTDLMARPGRKSLIPLAAAAAQLETLCLIYPEEEFPLLQNFTQNLGLRLNSEKILSIKENCHLPYIEIDQPAYKNIGLILKRVEKIAPAAILGARLILAPDSGDTALTLVQEGINVFHVAADRMGRDSHGQPMVYGLRRLHNALVKTGLRDQITLIVSGGIAGAEHAAKAIACGADLVGLDVILRLAWGCLPGKEEDHTLDPDVDLNREWAVQRIVNLIGSMRDQLLEVLGAMGIRDIRRLRGEIGRTIWNDTEEEQFSGVLKLIPTSSYSRLPEKGVGGDLRWTASLLETTQNQAKSGQPPDGLLEYRVGKSGGGFDRLIFASELDQNQGVVLAGDPAEVDLSLNLNRRRDGRSAINLPVPWYGAGMSYGSVGLPVMVARAKAAQHLGTFISTGEGGYPPELAPYADHVITQVATGLFGVREDTIQQARIIELKYAQGAKPGIGGHLLFSKNTADVARVRETVTNISLFSPFPFHSVYSVEDHKKQVDWLKVINPKALISVKITTSSDVDLVAIGSYFAGVHIIHLDGAYGGTGAAPEIAKKNIALPIEYAIPKVHRYLQEQGVRDEIVVMASGGLRTVFDAAKAIALGADGVILGTAELVAIGCRRLARCEKIDGCPFGITTTDPELSSRVNADKAWKQIVNLYEAWKMQLAGILQITGLQSVRELRGRTDLLGYLKQP